jgi:hypothetical protein
MKCGQACRPRLDWLPLAAAVALAVATASLSAGSACAAETRLTQLLERPVTVAWQGQQLGAALERLAESQQLPIWVDRRVDPNATVELTANNQPLGEVLTAVTQQHGLAFAPFNGIVYVGPQQTAGELATLSALARQSLSKSPAEVRTRWLRVKAWSFARLSEPRALLGELTASVGARLRDDERIPHDLWPERSLPAMSTLDRVVLLLAGFDLTCQISPDGRQVRVVPIERPVHVTRTHTIPPSRAAAVDAALAAMPEAKSERSGQKLTLAATIEQHEQVASAIRGRSAATAKATSPRPPRSRRAVQRYTVAINNQPVGKVIDQLASQLNLEVIWPEAPTDGSPSVRDKRVSCKVDEASLDELLEAILAPADLSFKRFRTKVTISQGASAYGASR